MEHVGPKPEAEVTEEEKATTHRDPLEISRRLIYLHRLVGDHVTQPRRKMTRANPWRVTIAFTLYAFCATASIYTFSDIKYINEVNYSLRETLLNTPFRLKGNDRETLHNITEAKDIPLYIRDALLPQFMIGENYDLANTVLGFNKVLNQPGFCSDVSLITLTLRRMQVTTKFEDSTTSRFRDFYPKAWKGPGIKAGQPHHEDYEETGEIWASYSFNRNTQQQVPISFLGYRNATTSAALTDDDKATDGLIVHTKFEYTPECTEDISKCPFYHGFRGKGGYVAAIAIKQSDAHLRILQDMKNSGNIIRWAEIAKIVKDQYVYLLSPNGKRTDATNLNGETKYGACGLGVRATHVMRFQDFIDAGFVGDQTSSFGIDFLTYNANKQTATQVEVAWDVLYQGVVDTINPHIWLDTIKLDLDDTYYWVWEWIYILGTLWYFVELFVVKLYKENWKLFEMIWTYVNTISIVCSCISIAFRIRSAAENSDFLEDSANFNLVESGLNTSFRKQAASAHAYRAASAIAVLTIWLRVVELLAKTPPRVKLLEATLIKAMAHMCLYFAYILVIIIGFWSFATVHFAAHSPEFTHPFKAFISVFELLCLNVQPYTSTKSAPLRRLFFVPYMLFAIISVQMFNSIINYAYNRVSEDMEPEFKKAAREKKSKERNDRGWYQQAKKMYVKIVDSTKEKLKIKSNNSEKDQKSVEKSADVLTMDDLQPNDKEKVEGFTETQKKQAQGESFKSFCCYIIFALCYLMFLVLALDIGTNGMINEAVANIFDETPVHIIHPSGHVFSERMDDIRGLQDMSEWITHAIPEIVFHGVRNTDSFYDNKTYCLANWNCLVVGKGTGQQEAQQVVVRLTIRLKKEITNTGLVRMKTNDLPKARFSLGETIIPRRMNSVFLAADEEADSEVEDTTSDLDIIWGGRDICNRTVSGGYKDNGGIVCMLEADPTNLTRQLQLLQQYSYGLPTGAVILEMVAYNGNTNGVIYIALKFYMSPTGRVMKQPTVESFSLLPIETTDEGATGFQRFTNVVKNMFQVSMLFGFIYIALTLFFIAKMIADVQADVRRKFVNENKNCGIAVYEFFFKDVFHAMDTISYSISISSIVLFVVWLSQQLELPSKIKGNHSDFITFVGALARNNRIYCVLSSVNLLIIAVRPLKFLRADARMAKINLTFWNAMEDIVWFVIMLGFFFVGFVLFAHLMFGIHLKDLAILTHAFVYTFQFLIGQFNFWELWYVSGWAAIIFVFSFLFLFKFFFLNVFFAIIDKFFVSGETPPVNIKKNLKPLLGRLLRWIEWDDDYSMDVADKGIEKKPIEGPPSRAGRVHQVALIINEIRNSDGPEAHEDGYTKKSKQLADVCDPDERMLEVMRWSRDEAKAFVEKFRKLAVQKGEASNIDTFLQKKVSPEIQNDLKKVRETMDESERHQRYAILINESMEKRDQEILAKYILRLEDKITKKSIEMKALMTDVYHLRAESEKMRYADDDTKREEEKTPALEKATNASGALEDVAATHQPATPMEDPESDGEYAEAPPASFSSTVKQGTNKVFGTMG